MRAEEFCDHQKLQADGAATGYENVFAGNDAGFLHGFINRVDWLDEGGFVEADVVGQRDDAAFRNPGHRLDVFGKTPAIGSETRRETRGLVLLALGERPSFAVKTGAARNVMEAHHALAGLEFSNTGANGDNRAS